VARATGGGTDVLRSRLLRGRERGRGIRSRARAVLAPYVGDPRIAFVELRNEIETTDPAAMAWTRELIG